MEQNFMITEDLHQEYRSRLNKSREAARKRPYNGQAKAIERFFQAPIGGRSPLTARRG